MVNIVQIGDPVLRELAQTVPLKDIQSLKIRKIIKDMIEAAQSQDDGVAIAAPQIGVPLRIFIVLGKVLRDTGDEKYKNLPDVLVFINPEIVKLSKETQVMEEGCLSVRYLYGNVKRSKQATLRAYNELGEKTERGASGLLAQIFQHEYDHLDGVLFIDKATDIIEILPEDLEKELSKRKAAKK